MIELANNILHKKRIKFINKLLSTAKDLTYFTQHDPLEELDFKLTQIEELIKMLRQSF